MSQYPCCLCGHRSVGKLTNGYVSWYFPDEHRWCFYTRWCTDHFMDDVLPIIQHHKELGDTAESVCIVCGEETGSPQQTFLTLYPPKREQFDYAFTTCPECFEEFRNKLALNGKFVPDRGGKDGAQAWAPSMSESRWAQVEL